MPFFRRGLGAALAAVTLLAAVPAGAIATSGHALTAKTLASLDRLSAPVVSPDGRWVVYDIRSTDFDANSARHAAWLLDVTTPGATPRRLEALGDDASNVLWSADSRSLYFLSGRSTLSQVWRAEVAGGAATQLTRLPLDVGTFRLSRDGPRLVVSMAVFPDAEDPAATRARRDARAARKSTGALYDHLFIRHWNAWADGARNHLFALTRGADGLFAGAPTPLMAGFDGDTPSRPFGDEDDYAITPDGAQVVFSSVRDGRTEAWRPNTELWIEPMDGSAPPKDLTQDNPGADTDPMISPDGTRVAWEATRRPGYESDRAAVWIMDLKTGVRREADPGVDLSADFLAWAPDGRSLLMTAADTQQNRLFAIDVATGKVRPLTADGYVSDFSAAASTLVYARSTLESPDQLWVSLGGGPARQITHVGAEQLADVTMSDAEPFAFAGWNGETVHGYVIRPADYAPGKTYPAVLILHGGPEASLSNFWSYRWNPQVWAGWGFAVVTIDYHGSSGYGQAFMDAIDGHWGDRPLEDIQKGWAAALNRFAFIDGSRACAAGASFGGYLVYWMESQWSAPWKCLMAHDGVFDTRALGSSTDELWFTEWDLGGTPWDNPEAYETFNPARFTAAWKTPTLVVHSARDFRIPVQQGVGAFTTLQRRGVPSQFLTFTDENHWVLRPQNSVQWHDTVEAWLKRWTAATPANGPG